MATLKEKIETGKRPQVAPVIRYLSIRIAQDMPLDRLVSGVASGAFIGFDRKRFIERGGTPEAADKIEAAISAAALRTTEETK